MGVVGGMMIAFCGPHTVSQMVAPLLNAGWHPGNTVVYESYADPLDMGDMQHAPSDDLNSVCDRLDERLSEGDTVCLWLYWTDETLIHLIAPDRKNAWINFDGTRPTIPGTRFTDYTWVAERVLVPYLRHDCCVGEVRYSDDAW